MINPMIFTRTRSLGNQPVRSGLGGALAWTDSPRARMSGVELMY
jgi:hypothetical protein